MYRTAVAAGLICAALTVATMRADAAGIYEDAGAESALLLSGPRINVDGTAIFSDGVDADGSIYRLRGYFPVRKWFLLSLDQSLVSVSSGDRYEEGLGDLLVQARARLIYGENRALFLTGSFRPGTDNLRFFPYTTRTRDTGAALGYVDTLGAISAWASGGYTWVSRVPEDSVYATHDDYARFGGGVAVAAAKRLRVEMGLWFLRYAHGADRDFLRGAIYYDVTPSVQVFVPVQAEFGPEADRVSDLSGGFGVRVFFGRASAHDPGSQIAPDPPPPGS